MKIGGILAIVLALLIGGFVGWSMATTNQQDTTSSGVIPGIGGGPESDADRTMNNTDILQLNNLLREHGNAATYHLEGIYDDKNISTTQQMLIANSELIAEFFITKFDNMSRQEFVDMWQEHIDQYELYTRALKEDDEEGKREARQNLIALSTRMGEHFNSINSEYEVTKVESLMREHVNLTLSVIDAHSNDDFATKTGSAKAALDQATVFAQYLVDNLPQAR